MGTPLRLGFDQRLSPLSGQRPLPLHAGLASGPACLRLSIRAVGRVAYGLSGVLMEDLVHDLPLPVDFEEREQISVAMAGPVVEFQPHRGNRVDDVDADNPGVEPRCRAIVVHIVKELLDGASEEVAIGIAEDGRVLVEGGLHVGALARLRAIDKYLTKNNFIFFSEILEHIFYVVHQMRPAFISIELYPFVFYKAPQYFYAIQFWRILWKIKNV